MDQNGTAKRLARAATITAFGLTLAACDQIEGLEMPAFLQGDTAEASAGGLTPAPDGTGETRDVEAPEVFQKTEAALWDGRPSLGGVWVAHPDVGEPERVLIRNEENGRFVTGALFRRERENPGPAIQVSSDAAEELGMLAGAPATLNVTALRREEVAPPAALVPETAPFEGADAALAAPAAISETPLDAVGDVAAPAASAAAAASVSAIASAAAAAPAAVPAPALPAPVAAPAPSPAPAASAAATSTIDAIAGAAAAVAAAEAEAGLTAAPDAVVGAPLDARGAPAADTIPLPEPITSGLEKPFVQVGIFSVEANANDAATTLRNNGVAASVVEQDSGGTVFWRVLVGPAPNAQERTQVLSQVQALGFNDAYFVSN